MANQERPPWVIAVFIALVLGLFGSFAAWNHHPQPSLFGEVALRLPVWRPWEDWAEEKHVAELAKAKADSLNKWAVRDSLAGKNVPIMPKRGNGALQFSDDDSLGMANFARALATLSQNGGLRVVHFGDSQIEGDRITADLRNLLQTRYGGEGPGMQPLVPFVPMASVAQSTTGNWTRMVSFGRKNDKSPSSQYGPRGVSHRYAMVGGMGPDASVTFKPRSYGYDRAKRARRFTLLHGPSRGPLEVKWYANDTLWKIIYLDSNARTGSLTVQAPQPLRSLKIEFRGESPDWYGMALDGAGGVSVDNVAMRGADGLSFTRMDRRHFIESLQRQPIGLVILQFGGNSVPYFKSSGAVARYGDAFRRQIQLFQEALPNADILVIGPSDMAVKEGLEWVSYPFVAEVRDALRRAAFSEGAAFFDVMDLMGGPGGMVDWVNQNPPLAGPDHIHFTPKGAKKVAQALVKALDDELSRHE